MVTAKKTNTYLNAGNVGIFKNIKKYNLIYFIVY